MAVEDVETKLAVEYEALRRREYELISRLLEILPRVDSLGEERVAQVRDALFHADHPYLMVFVGPFSSGKSSIINALLGDSEFLPVGPVPTTDRISILRWGEKAERMAAGSDVDAVFYPAPLLKKVSFVDTPGLESVFQKHEEITRKFLHRADVVFLVMLATQAMTARNLEYLQMLQEYGKKVIVLVNQADVLTPEEAESVRQYVLEQSQAKMGTRPEVWLVSARQGLAAHRDGSVDEAAWRQSGLYRIEEYVDRQLGDVERLRQKLRTPLQIAQNAGQAALTAVRTNQAALDHYQGISANIEQQLSAQRRELDKIVREASSEISDKFGEAAMRGSEAIRSLFQLSRALQMVVQGIIEMVGLAGLLRRARGRSAVEAAFQRFNVFEPVDALPETVDKLGPRLESRDVQDIDDLVKYAQREINELPPGIQDKVIGGVRAPVRYERTALQEVRPELETIEREARQIETEKLEQSLRNSLIYLAAWEILLVIFGVALISAWGAIGSESRPELPIMLLALLLGLGVIGLLVVPLRGRWLENTYTNRMLKLQNRYIETLSRAAEKQVLYAMQLRRDAVAPLARLIEAQTQLQKEQLNELQAAEQEMVAIEAALTKLGKKSVMGL